MCGISGIFRYDPDSAAIMEALLKPTQAMIDAQKSRGPDAQGLWHAEGVTLGHNRLAIMDPDNTGSNQPTHSARWSLVFNGEIYNFRALRNELKASHGFVFRSNSDTEVLLRAIDAWGIDRALERLSGIYAFAAYDKSQHRIYLARDRLGIKPLYFYVNESEIWFASTPAAIAKASLRTWTLDYEALRSFFALGAPFTDQTLFSGIRRLAPAAILQVDRNGKVSTRRYWQPAFRREPIDEAVERAIVGQNEAHVGSALFLSGGVDSTVMSLYLRNLDYFHLRSPEARYAQYVARFMGGDLCVRDYTGTQHFDRYNRRYVESSGEPSASAPIPLLIAEAIQASGYKVAFSANGADELFFGYPRTPAPELNPGNLPANDYEDPPVPTNLAQQLHIFRNPQNYSVPGVPEFPIESFESFSAFANPLTDEFPASAHRRWFELQTYVQYDLNATLDFASMACSLEVRVPFLDHELVEVALSHDANSMFSADFGRKTPLKRMLKGHGIHPLLWARPKIGFSIPEDTLKTRKQQLDTSLKEVIQDGYLQLSRACLVDSRDHQYLSAAADAFLHWRKAWIDSGVVTP